MEDYHIHTKLSVCGHLHGGKDYSFENIVSHLQPKLKRVGFCDHVEAFTDVQTHVKEIRKQKKRGWENVFFGVEVSFLPSVGMLSLPKELEKEFDYIIGSVHKIPKYGASHGFFDSYMGIESLFGREKMISAYLDGVRDLADKVEIIGHPFSQFIKAGIFVGEDALSEFSEIIDGNALAEINLRLYRKSSPELFKRYLKTFSEMGCSFSIGSDAHSLVELDYGDAEKLLKETKIAKKRIERPVD